MKKKYEADLKEIAGKVEEAEGFIEILQREEQRKTANGSQMPDAKVTAHKEYMIALRDVLQNQVGKIKEHYDTYLDKDREKKQQELKANYKKLVQAKTATPEKDEAKRNSKMEDVQRKAKIVLRALKNPTVVPRYKFNQFFFNRDNVKHYEELVKKAKEIMGKIDETVEHYKKPAERFSQKDNNPGFKVR